MYLEVLAALAAVVLPLLVAWVCITWGGRAQDHAAHPRHRPEIDNPYAGRGPHSGKRAAPRLTKPFRQ